MTDDQLKIQIDQVKRELEYAQKVDPHVKDMFGKLMEDILTLPHQTEKPALEELGSQLEQQATEFEDKHPKLAAMLRQLMDLLAKMGI